MTDEEINDLRRSERAGWDWAAQLDAELKRVKRERPAFVVFDRRETMAQSFAMDAVTTCSMVFWMVFATLIDSVVWQVFTVSLFLFWFACKVVLAARQRTTRLRSNAHAKAWAALLPDDSE